MIWTHKLVDLLICTSIGVVDKRTILNAIRNAANHCTPNPFTGVRNLCIYYTGHGARYLGDWCICKDQNVTL